MSNPENFTDWRKSSHSPDAGDCVEAARGKHGTVGVRDTKHYGRGLILEFDRNEWGLLLAALKSGQLKPD